MYSTTNNASARTNAPGLAVIEQKSVIVSNHNKQIMQVSKNGTVLTSSPSAVGEKHTSVSENSDNNRPKRPEIRAAADFSSVAIEEEGKNGWMETKPKRRIKQEAPALPLDWTRVKRRRTKANGTKEEEDCCPPIVETLKEKNLGPGQELVRGMGVFCLHDSDPSWFQGYFFPNVNTTAQSANQQKHQQEYSMATDNRNKNSNEPTSFLNKQKPWGLLASQEELDDCLRCADGGYRRITLTVFSFRLPDKKKTYSLNSIEWTGGDMMQLMGERASFEPNQLLTGKQAVPHVEKLFGSLLQKCRAKLDEEDEKSCSVLELIPDVAVISGPMKLVVPKTKDEDDEDWLG